MLTHAFPTLATVSLPWIFGGVFVSIVLGFTAGNYACSLVHRLPRGKLMLDKTPYCGSCGALLRTADLFPVISALLLKHHCRYCGAPYPKSHTWTELACGVLFVLCFLKFNFTQEYLLVAFLGSLLIALAAIEVNEGVILGRLLVPIAVLGMLWRTVQDGNVYDFMLGGLIGVMLGAIAWHKQVRKEGHIYVLPAPAYLLGVAGIILGQGAIVVFSAVMVGCWLILRKNLALPYAAVVLGFLVAT